MGEVDFLDICHKLLSLHQNPVLSATGAPLPMFLLISKNLNTN